MRTLALVLLLALAYPSPSAGQTQNDQQQQAIKKGRLKVWTGVAMIAAGAAIIPITAVDSGDSGNAAALSVGLIGIGGTLIYLGSRQQQKAVRPSTTFGVVVGRKSAVVIRRSW